MAPGRGRIMLGGYRAFRLLCCSAWPGRRAVSVAFGAAASIAPGIEKAAMLGGLLSSAQGRCGLAKLDLHHVAIW